VDRGLSFKQVSAVSHDGFDTYGGQINFGAGKFVLTDNQGTYASTDGITWSSQVPFSDASHGNGFGGHFHGVAYGKQKYLALQDDALLRVYDGATWFQGLMIESQYGTAAAAFGNDEFVVVGQNDTGFFTATSTDAESWGNVKLRDSANNVFSNLGGGVLFDGTTFHAYTQYSNQVGYTSSDGLSWTKVALSNNIDAAAYLDGHYFGAGDGKLWVSSNGISWTAVHTLTAQETFKINGPRVAVGRVLK
jgi:hypothetical protein